MLKKIYLDYASATPIDKRVSRAILDTEKKFWQNPSALHGGGVLSSKFLLSCRKKIAELLNAHHDEIIFTSGSTESNNLAILGVLKYFLKSNKKASIFVLPIDHPSIIETAKNAHKNVAVGFLSVDKEGFLEMESLKKALTKNPTVISFGYVNGEIGTVQNIKEIMKAVRKHRKDTGRPFPYIHIDATQAVGILPLETNVLGIDLMSIDSSKFYGPKGVGALFVRRGVFVAPLLFGGGQEDGRRSGTENLPGIAGFTKALEISKEMEAREYKRLQKLQKNFIALVLKSFKDASINGPMDMFKRSPAISSFCFPEIDSEQAVFILDSFGISVSPSSSCQNLKERSNSYVVESISKDKCGTSSLRFSFGRSTTKKDFSKVMEVLKKAIEQSKNKKFTLTL